MLFFRSSKWAGNGGNFHVKYSGLCDVLCPIRGHSTSHWMYVVNADTVDPHIIITDQCSKGWSFFSTLLIILFNSIKIYCIVVCIVVSHFSLSVHLLAYELAVSRVKKKCKDTSNRSLKDTVFLILNSFISKGQSF